MIAIMRSAAIHRQLMSIPSAWARIGIVSDCHRAEKN
jgi:hypothetical protein